MPLVAPWLASIQYDGTNGEFIAGTWCTGIGFVSDTGTVMTYTDWDTYQQTANVGDWFVINEPGLGYPNVMTNAEYLQRYVQLSP